MAKLPIYLVDEDKSKMLVNSIVDNPAHGKKIMKFAVKKPLYFVDNEQRIVKGVVLSADQPIYRRDEDGEYYVVFTEKAIRNIAERYFNANKYSLLNINHDGENSDKYATLVETYFTVEDGEFNGQFLKKGSWIASYKIHDDKLWDEVKGGKFGGFSVEVVSDLKLANFKTDNKMSKEKKTVFEKLADLFKELSGENKGFGEATTVDGQKLKWEGDLAVGTPINIVAEDGTETLAPEGKYIIEMDGTQFEVVVNAEGKIDAVNEVQAQSSEVSMEDVTKLAEHLATFVEEFKKFKSEFADYKKTMDTKLSKFNKQPKTPGNNGAINWDKLKV